ncbi:NUDIX domain-containing protein [Meridianimarinicoccus aquatilis]|uniref:NUDIX domain-containing protein n=1 Tax=Meridianimarinicoccus aquatilis TaxID=2552766 RepID=A0A4R6AZ35_9RHOB|nr:NUDIX domain-containing protein [Fluviibacterium aquatile]TDL89142.1 NUDIX domain-containing protein [Fluviibacterium aquatile]
MPFLLMTPFDDPTLFQAVTGLALEEVWASHDGGGIVVDLPEGDAQERLIFYAAVHAALPEAVGDVQRVALTGAELGGRVFAEPFAPRWLSIWREAVSEIVDLLGVQNSSEAQSRLNMIWARADARVRARTTPRKSLGGFDESNLNIQSTKRPYARYFAVEDYVYSHDRFDGTDSGPLDRACFIAADAVTVLPYDPVRDCVLVVEQVRVSPIGRADPSPWLPEPVAGRIEPGDTPEDTAHKETWEEAGLKLSALHAVADYYPTTGAFSEYIYSYIGIADLPESAAGLGGLATEGEDIRGHIMPRTELLALIAEGRAPVGTLQLSVFWLELNHSRLRQSG